MDKDTYLSISTESSGQYKEKGSKFLSFAFPVESEEEIKIKIDGLKKLYHDARHHCYAYMLTPDQSVFRANDDGEPKHSAGDPILNQIKSFNLSDTLIIVVRYFGGTKLGIPGLINAYKTAAHEALNNNKIIKKIVSEQINVFFSYEVMNDVMRLTREPEIKILKQQFTDKCYVHLSVRKSLSNHIRNRLSNIKSVTIDME
ncbi:IMPACT family protein [Bacteroidota bacterium]